MTLSQRVQLHAVFDRHLANQQHVVKLDQLVTSPEITSAASY